MIVCGSSTTTGWTAILSSRSLHILAASSFSTNQALQGDQLNMAMCSDVDPDPWSARPLKRIWIRLNPIRPELSD